MTDELLAINIKAEQEEIYKLEAEVKKEDKNGKEQQQQPIEEPEITFKCECGMEERVHYFGDAPPFAWGIKLLEDSYVMRDPFQPPAYPRNKPKPENFIIMGANCSQCKKTVCKGLECSFYYTRTFCLRCAEQQHKNFPTEVQTKLKRQLEQL